MKEVNHSLTGQVVVLKKTENLIDMTNTSLGLEALANMEYPGRFIVLGYNRWNDPIAVYGLTGRSPSSQARKLVSKEFLGYDKFSRFPAIFTEPTDNEVLKDGDPGLLIYPAMIFVRGGIAVSNGQQTGDIHHRLISDSGEDFFSIDTLTPLGRRWSYERDSCATPRISGCISNRPRNDAVLSIIKRGVNGFGSEGQYFEVREFPREGTLISTYTGKNVDPLLSFKGEPLRIGIPGETPEQTAKEFYEAMGPKKGDDFRVAVAVAYLEGDDSYSTHIINRHG